jgi:hypothetical protein
MALLFEREFTRDPWWRTTEISPSQKWVGGRQAADISASPQGTRNCMNVLNFARISGH